MHLYYTFVAKIPKTSAVCPMLSVQTFVFGGIFLAPQRRKFNTISNAKNTNILLVGSPLDSDERGQE